MAQQFVICAVRKSPEPEILEVTVPHWAVTREIRRLQFKGWETVFTLRTVFVPNREHDRERA